MMEYKYGVEVACGNMSIDDVPIMFREKTSILVKGKNELLAYARDQQWEKIKSARDAAETAGLPFKNSVLDYDMRSAFKLEIAAQAAKQAGDDFQVEWTMQDNSVMLLTKEDLLSVPLLAAQYSNSLHEKARKYREQLEAATDIKTVMKIRWE